jgi:iron uptake system EfeUOB component EfeO/EfeM
MREKKHDANWLEKREKKSYEKGWKEGRKELIEEIEKIKIVNEKDVYERIDYPNFIVNLKDWEAIKK